jgi:hypothetical protein
MSLSSTIWIQSQPARLYTRTILVLSSKWPSHRFHVQTLCVHSTHFAPKSPFIPAYSTEHTSSTYNTPSLLSHPLYYVHTHQHPLRKTPSIFHLEVTNHFTPKQLETSRPDRRARARTRTHAHNIHTHTTHTHTDGRNEFTYSHIPTLFITNVNQHSNSVT